VVERRPPHRGTAHDAQSSSELPGSCALLVIQGHRGTMTLSQRRVVRSNILVNPWQNEPSCRDQLGQHLVFTKSAHKPTMGSCPILVIRVAEAKPPRASRRWHTRKSSLTHGKTSNLAATHWAVTWHSPKAAKSQHPLPPWGMKPT
jgi:hypothetical protein